NRGESGDNAIGSQLFDGLGLIRTEELLVSNEYYGVDRQYFTTVIDYGFSKRLDEALEKWGRENVLRDVVRVIRTERPFVLVSRFQGNERDGHGNHQTAGLLTTEAFKAAGDPAMFPEQVSEGLRPWQPFKVYIGGSREEEPWNVRIDSGQYSPWLGDSYNNFARRGLSFQRSQTSGQFSRSAGPSYGYYTRAGSRVQAQPKEAGFFEGIDTSIPALFRALGRQAPAGVDALLASIARAVTDATAAFKGSEPSAIVPMLAAGLAATREAITTSASEPEAVFLLRRKEQQFVEAINIALGIHFEAVAQSAGMPAPTGPGAAFAAPPVLDAVVPGQAFEICTTFANRAPVQIALDSVSIEAEQGWQVTGQDGKAGPLAAHAVAQHRFDVTLSPDTRLSSKPYFTRTGLQASRYTLDDPSQFGNPRRTPPATAVARYTVNGTAVELRETVRRREPRLPYGTETRQLRVVPAVALRVSPGTAISPLEAGSKTVTLTVDLLNNKADGSSGELTVRLPSGWTSSPSKQPFTFTRAG
ncbi:MAG: PIG-L family deacetylase, partial [Acidobacteriota bacterium]|nr:PIG-L family deacetylase [Acidobacteriota bacterium]